jgi:biotin carboxyl carrier protein
MKFVIRTSGEERTVVIDRHNGVYDVEIDGRAVTVDCAHFGDTGYLSMLIDNQSYLIESAPTDAAKGQYFARVMGRHYDLEVLDELLLAVRDAEVEAEHHGAYTVAAPMPGLIVDIKVKEGDHVEAGAPVVIMEAMKMQNELTTQVGGVVKAIHVGERDSVDSQTPLVVIERE